MPSGPPELHEKWKDDGTALKYLLDRGYKEQAGLIRYPSNSHEETKEECSALDYLCFEWDYAIQVHSKEK